MTKWIGLTGTIGSGKSTVAEILWRSGYSVLDADKLSKELTAPGMPAAQEVIAAFGDSIHTDGVIDRTKLGDIVFADKNALQRLEGIVHPRIVEAVTAYRKRLTTSKFAFYDVPLLFEKNMQSQFDAIVTVTAPMESAIDRVKARSGLNRERFLARFSHQVSSIVKIKNSTWVIDNDGSLGELKEKVFKLANAIEDWCKSTTSQPIP